MPETKRCPFCAEEIQYEAIKCKHCGEWFKASELTQDLIDRELRVLLLGVVGFILTASILWLVGADKAVIGGLSVIVFLSLVIRVSLFLKQPLWLTIVYCVAVIIQLGVIFVVLALIYQLNEARKEALQSKEDEPSSPRITQKGKEVQSKEDEPSSPRITQKGLFNLNTAQQTIAIVGLFIFIIMELVFAMRGANLAGLILVGILIILPTIWCIHMIRPR